MCAALLPAAEIHKKKRAKKLSKCENFRLATEDFFSEKLQSNYLTSSCIDFGDFSLRLLCAKISMP